MRAVAAPEIDERELRGALRMHEGMTPRHFCRSEDDVVVFRAAEREGLSDQGKLPIFNIKPGGDRRVTHSFRPSRMHAKGLRRACALLFSLRYVRTICP